MTRGLLVIEIFWWKEKQLIVYTFEVPESGLYTSTAMS